MTDSRELEGNESLQPNLLKVANRWQSQGVIAVTMLAMIGDMMLPMRPNVEQRPTEELLELVGNSSEV